jgi:RHS repeat-associated protein
MLGLLRLSLHALRLQRALLWVLLAMASVPVFAFHASWDGGQPHILLDPWRPPPPGPCSQGECDTCNAGATRSPAYAATGHAVWQQTDINLAGTPYVGVIRTYNSNDPVVGLFGNGWAACFDVALYPANFGGYQWRVFKAANGKRVSYGRRPDGSYATPAGRFETVVETASGVTLTWLDGSRLEFRLDGTLTKRVDASGRPITFSYQGASTLPTTITHVKGKRSLSITYNANSLVETIRDHSGRTWRYAYDAQANLISVTNPAGGVLRYTWQAYRATGDAQTYYQLLSVTDPGGVVQVQYTYTGNQVLSYTEGANRFTYNRQMQNTGLGGNVTQSDLAGISTGFTYGSQGLVTFDTDGIGGNTRYTYDTNGRPTVVTDSLGREWRRTFDTRGRVLTSTNPLNQTTTLQYAGTNPAPVRVTSAGGRIAQITFDSLNRPTAVTDPSGATTLMEYNDFGFVRRITNALNQVTNINTDGKGLPTSVTDALGRTSTLAYDTLGRLITATNPAGEVTRYSYDLLDRVVSVQDPLNQTTGFAYDAAGRLTRVTDAKGSITQYEYDTYGRRSAEVAPDGRRTTYAYRVDNLLQSITWPDNSTISYTYDNNRRVTRETTSAIAGGAASETITYGYNAVNQLTSASGPGGSVTYTYDNAGRLATETSAGRTHTSVRNADGERIQLQYLGLSNTYVRDARGLVSRITAPAGNFDFSHDALGRRTQLSYPNGSSASYSFDAAGQLSTLTQAGAFTAPYSYSYDTAGRITSLAGDGATWAYSYDALGRLTNAQQGAQAYPYSLDAVGNILSGGRTYDVNHRLTSDAAKNYSYDQRGNLTLETDRTTGARVVYGWNVKNQLLRVDYFASSTAPTPTRTLQFSYDPLGRRASKTDNGVVQRFVYDGDDLVGTLDAAGNVSVASVFSGAIDEPLATTPTGGAAKMLHGNHLGSVVGVSEGGATTQTYRYGPYGQTLSGSSADGATPFRYTGREKDTEELYYYRARYYSTSMMRFVSADPIGLMAGVNTYGYVIGNPISLKDPTGTIWLQVGAGVLGGLANVAQASLYDCKNWKKAFFNGFVGGVVGSFFGPVAGGAVAGGITDALNQGLNPFDPTTYAIDFQATGIATLFGGAGGRLVKTATNRLPWNVPSDAAEFYEDVIGVPFGISTGTVGAALDNARRGLECTCPK